MVKRRLILNCVLCAVTLLIAACGGQPSFSSAPTGTPNQPTAQLNLDDAQRIAADFLNGWVVGSYDAMYGLLTLNSRDAFPRADFEQLYTNTETKITLLPGGKSYTLTNLIQQGGTVQVAYNVAFKTKLFDTVTDSERILRLVSTKEGWRVAWSPDDIFMGLKDGAFLDISETMPNRGNIYDRDGNVIADQNGVAIRATLLTQSYPGGNPENCFSTLAGVFKLRTAEQMKTLFGPRTGQPYAFDLGEISQDDLDAQRPALEKVCTLTYTTIPTRRYVAGGLAPHIVGYVGRIPAESVDEWIARGYSPDALVGIDGIEHYWENTLAGQASATLTLRSRGGETRILAKHEGKRSQSVYLTLDRKLQESVQDMFKDAFTTATWGSHAAGAAAVVMDVHTGEILAIASYPDFNVDAFNPYSALKDRETLLEAWAKDKRKPTFSRATLGQYPLGSVFKIVSMAAAADSGKFNLNSTYVCTGVWNGTALGDRRRTDWIYQTLAGQHGAITLKQALTGSCDTYFWYVGWTLNGVNPQILVDYAKQMGFGGPTGIKDVSEAQGTLPDPANYEAISGSKWRGSDALNLVIGQGDVQVTPLQTVRMIAAVANGGTLYQPLLVQKVGIINEPSYVAKPIPNGKLTVKPDVLAGIRDAMCQVTTNQTLGTATFVFKDFKGAVVCGKTGTAQAGGAADQSHAWFGAFAGKTAETPDIAVVVVVEHGGEGSFIAAPFVRRIVEQYYDLPITPWPSWWATGVPSLGAGGE